MQENLHAKFLCKLCVGRKQQASYCAVCRTCQEHSMPRTICNLCSEHASIFSLAACQSATCQNNLSSSCNIVSTDQNSQLKHNQYNSTPSDNTHNIHAHNEYDQLFLDSSNCSRTMSSSNIYHNPNHEVLFIHINIRSLNKNVDKLHNLITNLVSQPDIIAITETKIKNEKLGFNVDLENYDFIHSDSPTNAGGVGLYIKKSIKYNLKSEISLNCRAVEDLWIEMKIGKKSFTVGVIYRHPVNTTAHIEEFNNSLNDLLIDLNIVKTGYCILGDFNIDFLKIKQNEAIRRYANTLISCCVSAL